MCLYPQLITNPKYKSTKKNGGNIPPIKDKRTTLVPIGCKQCIECKKQKSREWQTRLMEDIKSYTNAKFVTLTFSDKNYTKIAETIIQKQAKEGTETATAYELDNEIAIYAVRHFLERWRKKYKKSLRHWLVTELGHNGTENMHLHGLIWTNESMQEVENAWQYGWIWKGKPLGTIKGKVQHENYVNEKTINYIIKYIYKQDEQHPRYQSIILTSPGIGHKYTDGPDAKKNTYKDTGTKETYRTRQGHKIAMPIYWRNKLYSEEEREKLWIEKIDKEERWILGNKISIKENEEEYYKALKYAQAKNTEMGYGGNQDQKTWEQEQYERQRRIIKQQERMEKAKKRK